MLHGLRFSFWVQVYVKVLATNLHTKEYFSRQSYQLCMWFPLSILMRNDQSILWVYHVIHGNKKPWGDINGNISDCPQGSQLDAYLSFSFKKMGSLCDTKPPKIITKVGILGTSWRKNVFQSPCTVVPNKRTFFRS